MDRLVQINQLFNGRWRVCSRTGKNLGTFSSRRAAQKRATQFEKFVRMNRKKALATMSETLEQTPITYSSVLRQLRQKQPEMVKKFMQTFKHAFDQAVAGGLDDLEHTALLESIHKLNLQLNGT